MKILKKLAAAVAIVMAVSTLAACGDDDDLFLQAENDPTSKIQSADSIAKEFITTVNSWIADHVMAGGEEARACELRIVMDNGDAAVTDNTGKNDWEARPGCPESLEQRFESDYSARTFTAKVFIDDSGYAIYSWYVPDNAGFNGAAPSFDDFNAYRYNWGTKNDGLTSENVIIGTYPKLISGADER